MKRALLTLAAFLCLIPSAAFAYTITLFPSGTVNDVTQIFGDGGNYEKSAERWVATTSLSVTAATVEMDGEGTSPTDNYFYQIYNDAAGVPGAPIGSASNLEPAANVPNDGSCSGDISLSFPSPVSIPSAGTYWLVISRDGGHDETNYLSTCDFYGNHSGNWYVHHQFLGWLFPGAASGDIISSLEVTPSAAPPAAPPPPSPYRPLLSTATSSLAIASVVGAVGQNIGAAGMAAALPIAIGVLFLVARGVFFLF